MSRRDGAIVAWHKVPLEFGHFEKVRRAVRPPQGRNVAEPIVS